MGSILQRLLPPEQLDRLFEQTAEKQYQRELFFSTLMTLMLEVVLKSSPSVHHSYKKHQDDIAVSIKSVYNKLDNLEPNIAVELVRGPAVQAFRASARREKPSDGRFAPSPYLPPEQHDGCILVLKI